MLPRHTKTSLITIVLLLYVLGLRATTWSAALPYVQTTKGQRTEIRAKAYEPYMPNPYGETEVYLNGRLLYSIDKYYRNKLYTSEDGTYLAIVATNNLSGVSSVLYYGQNWINFDEPAITIYKNGESFKTYKLRDVIDTARLLNDGVLYQWGYSTNWNSEKVLDWKFGCESCAETYSKQALASCDTNEIDLEECKQCRSDCDSFAMFQIEKKIAEASVYVQNNILHVITNQGNVLLLNFHNLALSKMPVEAVLKDKRSFAPPATTIVYDTLVRLPEKFDEPTIDNGKNLEQSLVEYLRQDKHVNLNRNNKWDIVVRRLVINNKGLCEELDIYITGRDANKNLVHPSLYINNEQLQEKIEHWLMTQSYDKSSLPKGFKKYSYYTFLHVDK